MPRKYRTIQPPKLESIPAAYSNLGLVYRHVAWDPELPLDQRRRFLWALDFLTIGQRHYENEPIVDVLTRLATDLPSLRPHLRHPPRAKLDCTVGTWRNVRAAIFAAMRWCGLPVRARQRRRELSPRWMALIGALPRYHRLAVEPFADWCDRRNTEPRALNQETFDACLSL